MSNNLITTNKNAKLALSKSKSLLDITNKLLSKKENEELIQSFQFKPFLKERGHSDGVFSVAITPDGKTIVSGSRDTTIKIWDMHSSECLKTLSGHLSEVNSVAISLDGKSIVSGSWDKIIKIWDMQSGECLKTLKGHSDGVFSVAITPDGKTIVSGSGDETIKIWDMQSGECLKTLKGHSNRVHSVAITPDRKSIVSGSGDKTIKIWDMQSGECLKTLKDYSNRVHSVAISLDGKSIVSANSRTIRIWDMQSGECVKTLKGHPWNVESVKISPNGKSIVSGSDDKTIKIWDMQSGECVKTLKAHLGSVSSIAINQDGKSIVSGSRHGTIKIWDFKTGKCLKNLKVCNKEINSLQWNDNGKSIISAGGNDKIKIWDIQKGILIDSLSSNTTLTVKNIILNTKYNLLFCFNEKNLGCRNYQEIRLFNVMTHEEIWHSEFSNIYMAYSGILTPKGTYILIGKDNYYKYNKPYLSLINLSTKKETSINAPDKSTIHSMVMTSDEKYLIASNNWGTYMLDFNTFKVLKKISQKASSHEDLQLSIDNQIFMITNQKKCYIYNLKNLENISLLDHPQQITSASISLDNTRVVTGCTDGTLRLWDISTSKCIYVISGGHQGSINSVLIHPNKNIFVSGGNDGKIKFWNMQSGNYIYTIDHIYETAVDQNSYFSADNIAIENYIRVSEAPLSQRKLTNEEIKHFRKKGNFLEVGEIVPKPKVEETVIKKDWDLPF